jgi:hypothetical protein
VPARTTAACRLCLWHTHDKGDIHDRRTMWSTRVCLESFKGVAAWLAHDLSPPTHLEQHKHQPQDQLPCGVPKAPQRAQCRRGCPAPAYGQWCQRLWGAAEHTRWQHAHAHTHAVGEEQLVRVRSSW